MAYTIQSGDTLSQLAQTNKTTVADLMKSNPTITDPNKIYAGASLNLPTTTPSVVASSSMATDLVNNQIKPTLDKATTAITTNQQTIKDTQMQNAATLANKTPTPPAPSPTPEQQIVDDPGTGNKWIYDKTTGQRTAIPTNQAVPSTSTTVDVKNAIAQDTTESSDGRIVFKKLADGNVGKYDPNGNYLGLSTQTEFDKVKTGQTVSKAYDDAVLNGAHLKPEQVAQIESIKQTYQRLLDLQAKANANYEGGMTVAQNLYGIGTTMMGTGAIKGAVDEGVAKLADINSKMNSDVSKMTSAFQSDNLQDLKGAYESFVANSASLQKEIDTQHATVVQEERDIRQQTATAQNAIDNDIRGLSDALNKSPGVTTEQKNAMTKALQDHDYNAAFKAVGNSLETADGWMGTYLDYAKVEIANGRTPKSPTEFKDWDDNNKAAIAKAGVAMPSAAAGGGKAPFQGLINNLTDTISSESGKKRVEEELGVLMTNGNYKEALSSIKTKVKTSSLLPAADRSELINAEKSIPFMDRMAKAITDYQNANGDMSYLKGKADSISSHFGKLETDPKYKALATELTIAFQEYRLHMTGAAFSAAESAEYASVIPSKEKNPDLNLAIIAGARDYLQNKVDDTYDAALGGGGEYRQIKALAGGDTGTHPLNQQADNDEKKINDFVNISKENYNAYNTMKAKHPKASPANLREILQIP